VGQVRITDAEIAAMAAHLGVNADEFIQRYTRLRADRRGLSLIERENGECVFLNGIDCSVQPVKPHQCRDFPRGWENETPSQRCQAVRD